MTVRCPICEQLNGVDLLRLADGPKCASCHRPLLPDRPIKATEADFDQTIETAAAPVLVDFYADWCAPCRAMAPIIDEIARDKMGEVLMLKVDTDRNQALTVRLGIRGIPTVIAFQGGAETGRQVGLAQRAQLEGLL